VDCCLKERLTDRAMSMNRWPANSLAVGRRLLALDDGIDVCGPGAFDQAYAMG